MLTAARHCLWPTASAKASAAVTPSAGCLLYSAPASLAYGFPEKASRHYRLVDSWAQHTHAGAGQQGHPPSEGP